MVKERGQTMNIADRNAPMQDAPERVMDALAKQYGRGGVPAGDTPGPECLSPEGVAAFVSGTLSAAERSAAEAHLADCDRCAAEVGSVLSVPDAGVPPTKPLLVSLHRSHWARAAALVLVGAALLLLGVGLWEKAVRDRRQREMDAILARHREAEATFQAALRAAQEKAQRVAAIYHLSPYKRGTLTPAVAAIPVEPLRGPDSLPADVRQAGEQAAQEAEKALDAVAADGQRQAEVWLAAAALEAERGRHAQALALVDKALPRLDRADRVRALSLRATILLDRAQGNDAVEGVTMLDDLIQEMEAGRAPMNPDVYYNRAMYDHVRGHPGPSTRQLWEHYLRKESDPNWRQVAEDYLKDIPK
jgi:tetratricopeptide (TPR) repeat protein